MTQEPEKYYVLFESWSLDPNQWSMVIDSVAVLLTISGFYIAFLVYTVQRKDSSKDAYDFFQSSLPELKQSILNAIHDLHEFHDSIDLDNFVNPVLSASLNDKFLNKINLVDLSRFYSKNRNSKYAIFRQFLVDSNFFGNYHSYITNEIDYFRTNYEQKKAIYSQWKLLRTPQYFSTDSGSENKDYKEFYTQWVKGLNRIDAVNSLRKESNSFYSDNQETVNEKLRDLALNISPYITEIQKANTISILANDVLAAHKDIHQMKIKIRKTLAYDIQKFERVLENLNQLVE